MHTESGHSIRLKLTLPNLAESSIHGNLLSASNVFHSSVKNRDYLDHVTVTSCKTIINNF